MKPDLQATKQMVPLIITLAVCGFVVVVFSIFPRKLELISQDFENKQGENFVVYDNLYVSGTKLKRLVEENRYTVYLYNFVENEYPETPCFNPKTDITVSCVNIREDYLVESLESNEVDGDYIKIKLINRGDE